jgi:hypothetical protein
LELSWTFKVQVSDRKVTTRCPLSTHVGDDGGFPIAWHALHLGMRNETRDRVFDAQLLQRPQQERMTNNSKLRSRLVYENDHSAFYIIARNTQLRRFSFANTTSLNEISLATFRRRASWASELEFISDVFPTSIPLLASTRLDCNPQRLQSSKLVYYRSATIFGAGALCAFPLSS